MLTPMVIIAHRDPRSCFIDASAVEGRLQEARIIGLSKWSAIPPVDQAIRQQSDRFGPAVRCAAVAVGPAWSRT
jgi:hypothetical protein